MMLRVGKEDRKDDRQNGRKILAHKIDDILVVPVIECPFRHLEVLAVDTPCQLVEKWGHNLAEFIGIDDIQHLLHLAEEHNLFR